MSELAIFLKAASTMLHEVFAKLSLVLLFQSIELTLVAVKVVIVTLLGKMPENL